MTAGAYEVAFSDMAENVRDTAQPTPDDSETYVGLEHLDSGSLRVARWGADIELKGIKLRMRAGDILFARRNAYLRRVGIAPFDGLFSAHGLVLRPRETTVVPEFLPYFMQSDAFSERAIAISVGSLSPTINWSTLASERFMLPSKQEQLRVSRLLRAADDALLRSEEVDARLAALAESMGDSLLALDGESSTTLGELVESGILSPPQDGNHGNDHPKGRDFVDEGIPFLTASDIRGGRVDLAGAKRLHPNQADALRIGFARPGDVLLTHKGTVGQVAVLPDVDEPYAMLSPQVTYYRVRDDKRLDRDFLYYGFRSPPFQKQLRRASQQSTRAYIGITKQRRLTIPLPLHSRQLELAARFREIEAAQAQENDYRRATAGLKRRLWVQICEDVDVH